MKKIAYKGFDYTGQVVNGFKVLGLSCRKGGKVLWRVLCPCGKERSPMRLDSMKVIKRACNCEPLKGDVCGLLTYKGKAPSVKRHRCCEVECSCGREYITRVEIFKNNVKGCGKCPNTYVKYGTLVRLDISTRKFPNTFSVIDADQYDKVKHLKWYAVIGGSKCNGIYVQASEGKSRIALHRFITGCEKGFVVDHISGDTLDNTVANLRVGTTEMNNKNAKRPSTNTSGRVGVGKGKRGKWLAYISNRNKGINLGTYQSFEEACIAREKAEEVYNYHKNHGRSL